MLQRVVGISAVWFALTLTAFTAPPKSGIIVDLVGKGAVTAAGHTVPAHILLRLAASDEVQLENGARMRISFLSDGHCEDAHGPCVLRITASSAQVVSGDKGCLKRGINSAYALRAPQGNLEKLGGFVVREVAVLNNGQPVKVWLTMKHAFVGVPHFSWDFSAPHVLPPALQDHAKVSVLAHGTDRVLWTQETSAAHLTYGGPRLQEDTLYDWQVTPERRKDNGEGTDPTGPAVRASFVILSRPSAEEIRRGRAAAQTLVARAPHDPATYALLEAFYADHYMLEEAADAGRKAVALRPDDVGLHDALQRIYEEMGDTVRARQEEDKVKALQPDPQ